MRKKSSTRRITFDAKNTTPIDYLGEKPFEYRGVVTGKLYLWRHRWGERIDVRDVPKLIKDVKPENLSGTAIDEFNEARALRAKKAKAKKEGSDNVSLDSDQDDAGA